MIAGRTAKIRARCATALFTGTAAFLVMPSAAQAQVETQVRVSAGAGAETNAFLRDGDDTTALRGTIEIEPSLYYQDERTTFRIAGDIRFEQYSERYGTQDAYYITGGGATRLNERTSLNATVGFRSSRNRAQDFIRGGLVGFDDPTDEFVDTDDLGPELGIDDGNIGVDAGLDPGEFPLVDFSDPTLAGLGTRSESLSASASIRHILSPRDSFAVGIRASERSTARIDAFDYRQAGAFFSWAHQLSPRRNLQTNIDASRVERVGTSVGDAYYVSPLIGISQQLSPTQSLTLQAGASFSWVDTATGETFSNTSFAFNGSFCNRGARTNLCINGSRSARPTTFGGLSNSTTVGVNYSRALSERDSISVNARYGRASRLGNVQLVEDLPVDSEVYGAQARYRTYFGNRLSAFLTAGVSDSSSNFGTNRDPNLLFEIGISYLFGEIS